MCLAVGGVPALAQEASESPPASPPGPASEANDWVVGELPRPEGQDALAVGVAVGPSSFVAVGQRLCDFGEGDAFPCWGGAWTSIDGSTWAAVDARTSGLDLGRFRPATSGPEVGLGGVAHGPGGFVAFGRVAGEDDRQRSAIWTSADGAAWQRVRTGDAFPAGTRLRTILGTSDGYLLGGVIYGERAPRAAVWSSPDGLTWTRARGRDAFDIGGFIDTGEDPASGGIDAFAVYPGPTDGSGSLAEGALAVGQACPPSFDEDIWASSGACWGQLWLSPDGVTWRAGDMPRTFGAISTVATSGERAVVGAPICLSDCPSATLVSDDGGDWRVAYGSPVGGELVALTSAAGRFYALLAVNDPTSGRRSLALWSSDDGEDWRPAAAQPSLPEGLASLYYVDMEAADDRLVVTAAGERVSDEGFASVALLSPPLP